MKRVFIVILALAAIFVLSGCEEELGKTYYYEAYRITKAQYNNFESSYSLDTNYTSGEIQGLRQALKSYNGALVESQGKVSETTMNSFLKQRTTDSDYAKYKNSLDQSGCIILFFNYNPDPNNYVVWMYIERE